MKVAICTPVHGDTKAQFTDCLAQMIIHSYRKHEMQNFMMGGSNLALNRETIADAALGWGADWLLWVDSDQTFPPDTLERLLAADKAVVGCNISKRMDPATPSAQRFSGGKWNWVYTTEALALAGTIEQVDALGLGVTLVNAATMRAVERPWFRLDQSSEDIYFFAKLSSLGLPIFVHHGVSWEVGHIGTRTFRIGDLAK